MKKKNIFLAVACLVMTAITLSKVNADPVYFPTAAYQQEVCYVQLGLPGIRCTTPDQYGPCQFTHSICVFDPEE